MTEDRQTTIEECLHDIRDRFGKLGLLVDDAPDASSRVARELYGAERLPEWWVTARSVECGARALRAFADIFRIADGSRSERGIALIDRFLPLHDKPERPTSWDAPRTESEDCREMQRAVHELIRLAQEQGDNKNFEYRLITSYPHVPLEFGGQDAGERFHWQTRSSEILFQVRREMEGPLRTFGPQSSARAAEGFIADRPSPEGAASWKARTWEPSIRRLAQALIKARASDSTPVVLFTGAGASLAEGPYGAGMPPTWWLLQETCRTYVHDPSITENPRGRLKAADSELPPADPPVCCCAGRRRAPQGVHNHVDELRSGAPIDRLIDYLLEHASHSASGQRFRLEAIFSHDLHRQSRSKRDQRKFHQHFRSHLERFDHGFGYHHWLLAQLPWTRIITTNFDSCHERAAFAAAAEPKLDAEVRAKRLQLGSVFPDPIPRASADEFGAWRLRKPYGNLLSPGEIALGDHKLKDFEERLNRALQGLEKAQSGWLVVVGHAMEDQHVSTALSLLNRGRKPFQDRFQLLWVVPEALERCLPKDAGLSTWEEWISTQVQRQSHPDASNEGDPQPTGPLPGKALDFAYDLLTEYRKILDTESQ